MLAERKNRAGRVAGRMERRRKHKNSGNEAKKSLKTKEVVFLSCAKRTQNEGTFESKCGDFPMKRKPFLMLSLLVAAAGFISSCGGGGGNTTPPPPSCPTGAVTLNPTTIVVGGTSTASAPSGWASGSFSANPPSGVVTISGNTLTGAGAGSATISGSGWTAPNGATGCSLTGATLTVTEPIAVAITDPNPVPTSVGSGETIQFGATVTGSSNVAVTWAATPAAAGTINSSTGLFTAAAVSTNTTATVTATATADTTKTATVTFTVTAASTITSIAPSAYYCDEECNFLEIAVMGAGFLLDYIKTDPDMNYQITASLTPDGFDVYFGLDTPHTSDGPFDISDCRVGGGACSNSATFLAFGNQNDSVVDPIPNNALTGEVFTIDRAAGTVWKFKPDGTPDGYFYPNDCAYVTGTPCTGPMASAVGIAFDEVNQWIWTSGLGFAANDAATGAWQTNANDSNYTNSNLSAAVGARNGIVCTTEPTVGMLGCFVARPLPETASFYHISAGTEPWSLAMTANGTTTLIAVIDRAVPTLLWFSATVDQTGTVITLTELGSVLIPFTPVSELRPTNEQAGAAGGWYAQWLPGGIVAVKAPVLNAATNAVADELWFVNTNPNSVAVSPAVELPANSFRMVAEADGSAVDVESAVISLNDPAKVLLTISRVPTTGAASTIYTATIDPTSATAGNGPFVGVGFGTSLDGTYRYTCARSQCAAVTVQIPAQ